MTNDCDELEEIRNIIEEAIEKAILKAEERTKEINKEIIKDAILTASEQTQRRTWGYMKELTGLDVSKPEEVAKIHDVFNYSKGLMDKTNKICDISLTAVTLAIIGSLMTAIGLGIKAMFFKG